MQGLFGGEVFVRSFSPLLGMGCLSPRLVAQALKAREGPQPFPLPFNLLRDSEIVQVEEVRQRTFGERVA